MSRLGSTKEAYQLRQVFVAQHPAEAHLVKGLLEANGIATEVRGESLFGARGSVPATPETLPSVWVKDDNDVARALVILADLGRPDNRDTSDGDAW